MVMRNKAGIKEGTTDCPPGRAAHAGAADRSSAAAGACWSGQVSWLQQNARNAVRSARKPSGCRHAACKAARAAGCITATGCGAPAVPSSWAAAAAFGAACARVERVWDEWTPVAALPHLWSPFHCTRGT